jgi:hypothetical protein
MRPQLPPVFVPQPLDKSGTLETQLQIGDLFFYLETDAGGTAEPVLTLAASAKVQADLSHEWDTNSLNIAFGETIVVIDTINNPLTWKRPFFENIGPLLIELVLPIIGQMFDKLPAADLRMSVTMRTSCKSRICSSSAPPATYSALRRVVKPGRLTALPHLTDQRRRSPWSAFF